MQTTRTFIAIDMPAPLVARLERLQATLADEVPGIRWSSIGAFHLTLAFLGDVANTDLNDVCRASATAAAPFAPFALKLEGLGAFPDANRPRTVWAGLTGDALAELGRLRTAVAAACAAEGAPPEDDRFHPHITLGRAQKKAGPPRNLAAVLNRYRSWSAGTMTVSEVVTYSSTLTPEGPLYVPLARAPLAARKGHLST
jgi:2'-5' RNA ligase